MEAQFFRFLKIVGVGFKARAESEGRLLFLKLGYSHEVELTVPPAVRVFCFKPNIVCCTGIDKQRVHQFAAAERISKKRTKNEAKTTKPDTEWKSVEKTKSRQKPKSEKVNPDKSKVKK
ncbi:ribosomal protein L6 [Tanacetum coccineum]